MLYTVPAHELVTTQRSYGCSLYFMLRETGLMSIIKKKNFIEHSIGNRAQYKGKPANPLLR